MIWARLQKCTEYWGKSEKRLVDEELPVFRWSKKGRHKLFLSTKNVHMCHFGNNDGINRGKYLVNHHEYQNVLVFNVKSKNGFCVLVV